MQRISNIPETTDYIKGVINLRGKIIPLIDMCLKFKKILSEYTDRTCIVVIGIENFTVGLIVDNVDKVIAIPDKSIVPPPSYRTGFQNRYIKGIGKADDCIRLLLDCEKLFSDEELSKFNIMDDERES